MGATGQALRAAVHALRRAAQGAARVVVAPGRRRHVGREAIIPAIAGARARAAAAAAAAAAVLVVAPAVQAVVVGAHVHQRVVLCAGVVVIAAAAALGAPSHDARGVLRALFLAPLEDEPASVQWPQFWTSGVFSDGAIAHFPFLLLLCFSLLFVCTSPACSSAASSSSSDENRIDRA